MSKIIINLKLAINNVKKSIKDYIIYFVTLTFGICIYYIFNSLDSQEEIIKVTSLQIGIIDQLKTIISYFSVLISLVFAFLISYVNKFIINRRKKEFAIYLLLGMKKGELARLLFLETMLIGTASLISGILVGFLLSHVMASFTAGILETVIDEFKFIFSVSAAVKVIIYFYIIFFIVYLFNIRTLIKYKLIKLLSNEEKNYNFKNTKSIVALFILSIIILIGAYSIVLNANLIKEAIFIQISIVLGLIGTLLFFASITNCMISFCKRKNFYYKELNMFSIKQLGSNLKSHYIAMSIVCLTLFLAISSFSGGITIMKNLLRVTSNSYNYDASFFSESKDTINSILNDKTINDHTDKFYSVNVIELDTSIGKILDLDENPQIEYIKEREVLGVRLSDYNNMLDKNQHINLMSTEVIITTNSYNIYEEFKKIIEETDFIEIDNKVFTVKDVVNFSFSNDYRNYMTVIFNDEYLENYINDSYILNIDFKDSVDNEKINDMLSKYDGYFVSKYDGQSYQIIIKSTITFLVIYLGLVFLITCSAVLALQQLLDISENKEKYKLLLKQGCDRKMICKSIFLQVSMYFIIPLFLAIIHSIIGLQFIKIIFSAINEDNSTGGLFINMMFVVCIYGIYYILTYIMSKNVILEEK